MTGGFKIIDLLLDHLVKQDNVTEDVVKAAVGNWGSGEEVMKLLLDDRGKEVKVTEDVVKAAAGNEGSGVRVIKLLLDGRAKIQLTEELVKTIAGKFDQDMMSLLLREGGNDGMQGGD
jgi:hypothetical protein